MDRRKTSEMEIVKQVDDIEKLNKMIQESKMKKKDKEEQKTQLQNETDTLRSQIDQAGKILEEKQNQLRVIREDNRIARSEVEHMEIKVGEAKDKIRRKEAEKLQCEKELADFN